MVQCLPSVYEVLGTVSSNIPFSLQTSQGLVIGRTFETITDLTDCKQDSLFVYDNPLLDCVFLT